MLDETVTPLDPAWGELLDVDVLDSGEWAGLFRSGRELFLRTASTCTPVPWHVDFPIIRCLDAERFVVVDTRTRKGRDNGWVIRAGKSKIAEFFAGDGIAEVLAERDTVVVTYFDEGVYSGIPPGEEGLVVFDGNGRLRAGYRSRFRADAVSIDDCYAACWVDQGRMAFFPYTGFPLVELDVATFEQEVLSTPEVVHGASAISLCAEDTLFFGGYAQKRAIVAWTRDGGTHEVGPHTGPLRGLRNGRFLTHGTRGFTVVERVASQRGVESDGRSAPADQSSHMSRERHDE